MLMIGPKGREEVPAHLVREHESEGWWKCPEVHEDGRVLTEPELTVVVPIRLSEDLD